MRLLFFISFLVFSQLILGQSLTATWSKNKVRIGEPVILTLKGKSVRKTMRHNVRYNEQPCLWHEPSKSLWQSDGLYEVLSFNDTNFVKDRKKMWEGRYKIVFWDSAFYQLPAFQLKDSIGIIEANPKIIEVVFQKKKVDLNIKELKVKPEYEPWILIFLKKWWWLILLFLGFTVAIILWNLRSRNVPKDTRGIKQRTLDELETLRKKQLWLNDQSPQHYAEFTKILKTFFSHVYEVPLLGRTTQETTLLLKAKGIEQNVVQRISSILIEADLIKFAKTKAEQLRTESTLTRAEELIIELSPIETLSV